MKTPRIPKIDSINELARFWDTHDLTEFRNELEEVSEPVFVRGTQIKVRLPNPQARAVRRIAHSKGLSEEELVRQWVMQKLAGRKPASLEKH